ncbi:MAG TPA: monovalent cation/H(+) antiporter subunit G [Kiritimatiellia bacterium]|nr:monovalent cation/H(+) antiporter subunit G [Kiritimatiellia bacterium]
MSWIDVSSIILLVAGSVFFLAGTVGILRFPDVYTRLHALTKADNLGLGLLALALILQSASAFQSIKLLLVWFLIMFSSSLSAFMVANAAHRSRTKVWRKPS